MGKRIKMLEKDVGGSDNPRVRIEKLLTMMNIDMMLHIIKNALNDTDRIGFYNTVEALIDEHRGWSVEMITDQLDEMKKQNEKLMAENGTFKQMVEKTEAKTMKEADVHEREVRALRDRINLEKGNVQKKQEEATDLAEEMRDVKREKKTLAENLKN